MVELPDGSLMSRADLPPGGTRRWVASRKAAVVRGVVHGLLTADEAIERYDLSEEELGSWIAAFGDHGVAALKTTHLQRYRQPLVDE